MPELSYVVPSAIAAGAYLHDSRALGREEVRGGGVTQLAFYGGTLEHLYEVAAGAFAAPTEREMKFYGGSVVPSGGTPSAAIADPEVLAATRDAPVLQALERLRGWINVSYDQLAQIVGVSPSLIHYWRRRNREGEPPRPRASTVERLWRVHRVVRALVDTLEGEESGTAVQLWMRNAPEGKPTPLDLLVDGRLGEVEARARPLLFDQTVRRPPARRLALLEPEEELELTASQPSSGAYEDADFG